MGQDIRAGNYLDELMKQKLIKIYVNDVELWQTKNPIGYWESNITIEKYEPLKVVIQNLDPSQVFDYDSINFSYETYISGKILTVDITPTTQDPDNMIWELDGTDTAKWDDLISGRGSDWNTPPNDKKELAQPMILSEVIPKYIARPTTPTENYPFIKIYDISLESLESLNKELKVKNEELEQAGKDPINNYISSLYRIPYPLMNSNNEVNIQIGSIGFETTANLISTYKQEFHLGSIDLSIANIGNIGYKDIEFMLYVPNFKPIQLDTEKVINKSLNIILIIDITTGKGTINIEVDGDIQYIENDYMGKDIPFRSDSININIGSSLIETLFSQPYVIVTYLEPANSITTDTIQQREFATLEYNLIKVDNVMLNTNATKEEQREIQRLLSKGVYVRNEFN